MTADRDHTILRVSELMIRYRAIRPLHMNGEWVVFDCEKGVALANEFDDEAAAKVGARRAAAEAICGLFDEAEGR